MIRNGNAGRPLYLLGLAGLRLEACRRIGSDRGRVQLLRTGPRRRHPRVGEVRLRVAQRIVAHTVKLGLLAIVDGHCHTGKFLKVQEG